MNVPAIEAKIAKYQEENAEQIMINRARKAEELAAALAASKGHPAQNDTDAALSQGSQAGFGTGTQGQYAPTVAGQPRPTGMGPQPLPLGGGHDMHGYAVDDEEMIKLRAERGGRAGGWSVEISRKRALEEAFSSIWTFDSSKKFNFSAVNSLCYSHVSRASVVNSSNRVDRIKVSGFKFEFSSISELNQMSEETTLSLSSNKNRVDESLAEQNLDFRQASAKESRGPKNEVKREKGLKSSSRKSRWVRELENLFVNDGELDVDYSVIGSDLSLEHCNDILKRLERCSDVKTLRFFEWMRSNGKLERNVSAFNLVLRVMGRREDWDGAEKLVQEVIADLGCELNYQVFNTLIYACCKLGRLELGGKWFRMMLEHEVQPNIATFGMLMVLYQKGWNVEEQSLLFFK
ncbi:cyclin-dependent kinase-activating kinase assembly factor-related / CDK-activating kinase assembly factor-related protein [Prunus dulcis]|uniref:Cyclin-dependent kinase-activating kinase assembly factor-related / CDK-activating kinase assembly factor-related protein n=1 Tax=Prunus dulcis TaxID=3755 RepID=A0A4Y1RY22_PRUDU|nr:cyclin-dependent kinase-activating kinase assembly factor-related / CDK-activating kinase assembly factor-related protein [Prunus dulcis]